MMRATILGCGSSGGVPRIGPHWGACDPAEPRNRRRRCALLIEKIADGGTTTVLIDTGPDMVGQLLDAGASTLDGVAWTHSHADHLHGIDDLRQVAFNNQAIVQGYADAATAEVMQERFGYIFRTPEWSAYPPVCALNLIDGPFTIKGAGGPVEMIPFAVDHGGFPALGYRVGSLVYLPDVKAIPETAWQIIAGAKVFICDALRPRPHSSHAHLDLTLEWMARLEPEIGIITNMHIDLDYATLLTSLPAGVFPAYDGMQIEIPG
ncbi:MBL fold metallo-hydrolase [Paracoccus pacificus]|uniref:MBL fold metallo-hydrolase n=1 Tax=Paracoccus pacificus TaxID=1463598 RepID=A0ABW4RDP0_9RHOB